MRKLLSYFAFLALLFLSVTEDASAQGCPVPVTRISNVTQNSAQVSAIGQARQFQVQYSSDNGVTWTTTPVFNGFNTTLSSLTPNTFYMIRARAICRPGDTSLYTQLDTTSGRGAFRTLGGSSSTCKAPEKIGGEATSPFAVNLFWSPITGATNYIVEYSSDEGMTWIPGGTYPAPMTQAVIEGLSPGTMYLFRVRTQCGNAVTEPSNFAEVWTQKADPTGCPSPDQELVTVNPVRSNSATVNWPFPNGNVSSIILVLKDANNNVLRTDTVVVWLQNFTYQNLTPGTLYNVELYSLCFSPGGDMVRSEEPAVVDFKTTTPSNTCPVPTRLTISQITEQSATATWQPVQGAVAYVFEYSLDGGNTWIIQEQTWTTYSFFGIAPNTTVKTRVKTLCSRNTESFYSPIVEFKTDDIACLAPEEMYVRKVGNNKISVTLQQPFNRRRRVNWWLNQINSVVAEGTSPTDSNIVITLPNPDGTYTLCFQNICTFNGETTTSESLCRVVSLAEECPKPIDLTYSFESDGFSGPRVDVKWNVPLPNNVRNYQVLIRFNNRVRRDQTWTNSYQMFGLVNGGVYDVCVYSVCFNDTTGEEFISDSVCTRFKYEFTSDCPTVTEFKVTQVTSNSAEITYVAVPNSSHYIIEYSTDGVSWNSEQDFDGSPHTIFGLQAETKYFVRITTVCKDQTFSVPSKLREFETKKNPNECPKVDGLRVSRITTTSARVDWRFQVNSPINLFVLALYSYDPNTEEWIFIDNYYPTRPPQELTGLNPGTRYGFVFASVCFTEDGDTVLSDTLVRIFDTLKDQFECPQPNRVEVTNITTTSARVSWAPAPNPGVTYIVRYWKVGDSSNVTTLETTLNQQLLSNLEPNTSYVIQVLSVCRSDNGGVFTSPPVTRVIKTREQVNECPTPQAVTVNPSETTAVVTWTGNPLARAYEVWLLVGGDWTLISTVNAPTTTYTLTNLVGNTTYKMRVRANCREAQSDFSTIVEFTTTERPCPKPTNLTVTNITYNSARATWTAVTGATNYVVTYYKDGDPNSVITFNETGTATNLAPLEPRTKYIVTVRARCENGRLSDPATTDFTTPEKPACNAPTNLTATDITTNAANLSWGAVTNAQSYEVRYRKVGDANYINFSSASTSRLLTNLLPNTEYEFCVRTICASDNSSEFSTCKTFKTLQVCNAPTNVRTTIVNIFDATVTWDVVSGATSYEVRYTVSGNTTTQTATTNTFQITGLSPSVSVIVQVRAICGQGNASPFSEPFTFTTNGLPCAVPQGLVVINASHNSGTVTWTPVPNAVSYDINITGPNNFNVTNNFTSPPATFTGLSQNTLYQVKIRTVCANNTNSDYSTVVQFRTTTFVCNAPTNLTVNNITATSGVASWGSAGNGVTYEVSFSTDNGTTFSTPVTTSQLTSTLSSLPSGTSVIVKVRTICGTNGQSDFVTTSFTTLQAGTCSTPTNLTVTNITTNQALVTWNVVSGAVSYQVSYKDVNATFFTTINVTTNSRILTNLATGTDYVVRVRARCSAGNDPFTEWTELRTFTTASETNVCGTPQIIDVVPGRNFADVSWTSVTGNNGYRVSYSSNGGVSFINLPWTNNTSLRISNLTPGKEYLVRVRARCTNGTQSPFSSAFLFTTLTAKTAAEIENTNDLNMTVYPNPTRGQANITFTSTSIEQVTIRLVDMTGREVYRQTVQPTEGFNDVSSDFNGLSTGMYHLQLIQQGRTFSSKLMIE